jgi:hypothetical protein
MSDPGRSWRAVVAPRFHAHRNACRGIAIACDQSLNGLPPDQVRRPSRVQVHVEVHVEVHLEVHALSRALIPKAHDIAARPHGTPLSTKQRNDCSGFRLQKKFHSVLAVYLGTRVHWSPGGDIN